VLLDWQIFLHGCAGSDADERKSQSEGHNRGCGSSIDERLPTEARSAKHEVLSGSAHKLRAVVKICERALVELENAVLRDYELTSRRGGGPSKTKHDLLAETQTRFDPLVSACTDLIRAETALVNGLESLPFVLGLFETKRLSVFAAIQLHMLGGILPLSATQAEPEGGTSQ
jgi:hypothetical protein